MMTGATAFDKWIMNLRKIPVNEHTTIDVMFFGVKNHYVPYTNIMMKNACLVSSLVGYM